MVFEIVAIVTPANGKEAELEELLKELTSGVEKHEPDVERYLAYKVMGRRNTDRPTEFVVIERVKDQATFNTHVALEYFKDLSSGLLASTADKAVRRCDKILLRLLALEQPEALPDEYQASSALVPRIPLASAGCRSNTSLYFHMETQSLSPTQSHISIALANVALKLHPVNVADFELISAFTKAEKGDLVAPGIAACWASPSSQRTQRSIKRDPDMFHNDASVRFLNVVNTEGELLSLGGGHFYENEYPAEQAKSGGGEVVEWLKRLNRQMFEAFMKTSSEKRRGQDRRKMWALTTLVNREPFRRRGVGWLIVERGFQQALKDRYPVYLEAVASAVSLYTALGFKLLEKIKVDFEKFRTTGEMLMASMAANLP